MIPVRILATSSLLPGRAVSNEEVARQLKMDPEKLARATGIQTRYWCAREDSAIAMATAVVEKALDDSGVEARSLRRLIFVTSGGGDWLCPANATAVIGALGLDGKCAGYDLSNACPGFLSAFDIGARYVATGISNVAIVVVETLSKGIRAEDPRPFAVLGDACAAMILGPAREGEGLEAIQLSNALAGGPTVLVKHPAMEQRYHFCEFITDNRAMAVMAIGAMIDSANTVLDEAGVALRDVDWVMPHQPNGRLLDALVDKMKLDRSRLLPVVQEVGSIGAASIPLSVDRLLRAGKVKPGQRILMITVGSPLARGAALYRVAPAA